MLLSNCSYLYKPESLSSRGKSNLTAWLVVSFVGKNAGEPGCTEAAVAPAPIPRVIINASKNDRHKFINGEAWLFSDNRPTVPIFRFDTGVRQLHMGIIRARTDSSMVLKEGGAADQRCAVTSIVNGNAKIASPSSEVFVLAAAKPLETGIVSHPEFARMGRIVLELKERNAALNLATTPHLHRLWHELAPR